MSLENTSITNNNSEIEKLEEGVSLKHIPINLQEKALAKINTYNSFNTERYKNSEKLGKVIRMMTNTAVYSNDFPKNIV